MKNQYELDYQQGYDSANEKWLERMDKIRAEIVQMDFDFGNYYDNTYEIIEMVLKVIDKYRSESDVK